MRGGPQEQNSPGNRACRLTNSTRLLAIWEEEFSNIEVHASFDMFVHRLLMFCPQGSGLGTVNGADNNAGTHICIDFVFVSVLLLKFSGMDTSQ